MFEPIRAALPEMSLVVEPVLDKRESFLTQSARPDASRLSRSYEPARLESADVFQKRGKGDGKRSCQLADAGGAASESPDHCSPRRIRQGGEYGVELYRMVSHRAKYYGCGEVSTTDDFRPHRRS